MLLKGKGEGEVEVTMEISGLEMRGSKLKAMEKRQEAAGDLKRVVRSHPFISSDGSPSYRIALTPPQSRFISSGRIGSDQIGLDPLQFRIVYEL